MAEEDKTFHKESKNGPRHRASEAFRKSQKPLRQLMKTATSALSRKQAFNLKRDLAFVGTRGEGLTRPDKLNTRTAAMLLHVLKSNGHLSMGAYSVSVSSHLVGGADLDQGHGLLSRKQKH